MQRLRTLSETECYHRLYGDREEAVKVTKRAAKLPRYRVDVTGEKLRQGLERMLDSREDEAA